MQVNRDAKRTADFPIWQHHVFTVTAREFERQRQAAEKVYFLTRPVRAATSPSHPEAAKTASLPRDAPFPMRRYRIVQILNVEVESLGGRKQWRGFSVRQDPLNGRTAPRSAGRPTPVFTHCGLARGTARLGAPGLGG